MFIGSRMAGRAGTVTRALLACGMAGGPLFVLVWFVEGATRPGYSPFRDHISHLSLGGRGWVQVTNFLVTGVLMALLAAGLRRALRSHAGGTWTPILVAAYAVGLLGAGVFVSDPGTGYPPGTPRGEGAGHTWHGTLHNMFSSIVFVALIAACFVLARAFARQRGQRVWALYSLFTGVAIFAVMLSMDTADSAGLFQRIAVVLGWGWITLIAFHLRQQVPATAGSPNEPRT